MALPAGSIASSGDQLKADGQAECEPAQYSQTYASHADSIWAKPFQSGTVFQLHPFERSGAIGGFGRNVCMPNALTPNRMTPAERLAELGCILAAGLIRMKANKSSPLSADRGESHVDFLPPQSGHATRDSQGGMTR